MRAFICAGKPRSYNAKQKDRYVRDIQEAYRRFHGAAGVLDGSLYGLVYYLHAQPTNIDADNLSKPIWDALRGVAYVDDNVIRHRRAGLIHVGTGMKALRAFDLSRVPDAVAAELMSAVGSREHIIYVEYGALQDEMFAFGLPQEQLK